MSSASANPGASKPDVAVCGSGIVAMACALALAQQPLEVALHRYSHAQHGQDVRAFALGAAAVALLESLKVWQALPPHAATPVHDMRVQGDDAGAVLRFSAWQQGTAELAFIVDAAALELALMQALRFAPRVHIRDAGAEPAQATLVVHAEGRGAAVVGARRVLHAYGQTAIAARLVADQAHAGLARQWFAHPDVLALLPLDAAAPGHGYALVWSLPDERAAALMAMGEAAFEQALHDATQAQAGQLRLASARARWPLALGHAEPVHGPGWVLVGDAAHVIHPLAGQGLNLGLGDVRSLAATLAQREAWRSVGDERLLARHARQRAAPVWAMSQLTDGLLHLFARPEPALRGLRNTGLSVFDHAGMLKRWLVAQAMR